MKTYSRETFNAASAAWSAGDFAESWAPVRQAAILSGIAFPPRGTRWDSWDDDEPSQRAIIARAIEENPGRLLDAIAVSRSWYEVVGHVLRDRAHAEALVIAEERRLGRRQDDPTRRSARETLARLGYGSTGTLDESVLFRAYRVPRRTEPCACGGTVAVYDEGIASAVTTHRATAMHVEWARRDG